MNAQNDNRESGAFELSSSPRFSVALAGLISDVSRETTQADVASHIARALVRTLGATTARVYLTDADGEALHLAAAENVPLSTTERQSVMNIADAFPACVAARLGLLQLCDAEERVADGGPRVEEGIAIPLFAGSETIGAVLAGFEHLTPRQCIELSVLSHSLGALLAGAGLREEVRRLQASARMREEQTALIMHDLRQPLSGVLVGASYLATRGDALAQPIIERLRVSAIHLGRMVTDLCDTSVLESGKLTLVRAPTDVTALVRTTVAAHLPAAELTIDGDIPDLAIDPQRIGQVLANLLNNAEKYGRGGVARVHVAHRYCHVVVSVTSEGAEIARDERVRIFDARYRGRDRTAGAAGLGLGLYICRNLVEAHGGRIWADGEPPLTCFTFTLPVGPALAAPPLARFGVEPVGDSPAIWTSNAEQVGVSPFGHVDHPQ